MNPYKYIIFNKPYGVLSQFTSEDHRTLAEFDLPEGVYAAGRLDKDSEGLLLLTNDGAFVKSFLDKHIRTYWVQIERVPEAKDLSQLEKGVLIKSGLTLPCKVVMIEEPPLEPRDPPIRFRKSVPTSWLKMELTEGKNRQVRKMTAAIGYPTLRLFRSGLGKIDQKLLKLAPGSWKEVKKNEII